MPSAITPEEILEYTKRTSRPLLLEKSVIAYFGDIVSRTNSHQNSTIEVLRERKGKTTLRLIWFEVAKRVIAQAIITYNLTSDQADAIKSVFIRPYDYYIET
jgi:hypothetical protein